MAERVSYRSYKTNTLILRQEDQPKSIYFIKAGLVKVLRKVDFRIPTSIGEANSVKWLISDPTLDEYENGLVESKLLEIDELTNGDCFSEVAAISHEPIKYSAITVMPSEFLVVDINDFMTLGTNFAESITKFARVVPSDSELRQALIKMKRWNNYKSNLTKSIKATKTNSSRSFDQQLRQNAQIPMKQQEVNRIFIN